VEARRAAQGETGTLSIGCWAGATSLFLPELIRAYRTQYPAVRIHLYEQLFPKQLEALELGRIDVGFMRPLPKKQAGRFVQERVYRDCVVAVLPDCHALAGFRKISLERLTNEDWVLLRRSSAREIVDGFTLLCTKAGFSPRVVTEPARIQAALMTVAAALVFAWRLVAFAAFTNRASRFFQFSPPRLHSTLSPSVLKVNRRR
jgi:DNA-binding transcriptional LysR family regulator